MHVAENALGFLRQAPGGPMARPGQKGQCMRKGVFRLAVAGFFLIPVVEHVAGAAEPPREGQAYLEEVVVTAQKRSEDLQKASLAVDVVQAEELASTGIRNAIDLQDIVPVVRYVAADQMTVQIRGLGTINNNPGVDSAVGYAEDGVYLTHPSALTPVLFDLKRVEVLLGPQGTLYGRNTNAGVLSFVTNDPSTDGLSGRVRIGGGNYSAFNSEAAINLPLSGIWALRLAGASEKHDGYADDGTNDLNSWAARAKLLFAPNASWSFKLTVNGGRRNSIGQGYGGQCPPGNVGPFCVGVPWRPWNGFTPPPAGMLNNYKLYGGSLDINGTLGWAILTSTTSYRGYDLDSTTAPAATPDGTPNFVYRHPDHDRTYTEEVRLASLPYARVPWVVGAYYSHESEPATVQFDYYNTILQVLFNLPPDFTQRFDLQDETNRSIAVFGDVTAPFAGRFRARAGLRYTNERKEALGTIDTLVSGIPIAPTQFNPASDSYSKLTWKAGLDFDVTPSNLLYATVSTGFKSGGLNNLPAAAGLSTYLPETITAYEIGSKNRFADNRVQLNVSLFHYDYKNYQTFTFYQPTGGPLAGATVFPTVNSQTATFEGGELQGELALSASDRLGISINVLNNSFDRFVIALPFAPVIDLSGKDVPLSPKTAASLSYAHDFALGSAGKLTFAADAHYSARYYATGNQGPTTGNALYTQPAYTKVNANLSWKSVESGWTVSAFVRNLTDKNTINTIAGGYPVLDNFLLINAMIDPPSTFGASVQKDF
jgi:iron complex outermembrane receptor protein